MEEEESSEEEEELDEEVTHFINIITFISMFIYAL